MSKWSELNTDVLELILQRLSIINNLRARIVCKNWYRVCKQNSFIEEKFPWMIIFSSRRTQQRRSLQLFNPKEGKFYKLKCPGESRCIATSGSWLLFNIGVRFYIFNIFTREIINLPHLESHQGRLQLLQPDYIFKINQSSIAAGDAFDQIKAVLWVDEKTKHYIVVWSIGLFYLMYTQRGFGFWKEIPTREGLDESLHGCQDLVFKQNKLYVLTSKQKRIRILDFSQELPEAMSDNVYHDPFINRGKRSATFMGVTASGDVFVVENRLKRIFNMSKISLDGTRWDNVESLGDESWIADLGVTVPAVSGATNPNSIYFSRDKIVYRGDLSTRTLVIQKDFTSRDVGNVMLFIPRLP